MLTTPSQISTGDAAPQESADLSAPYDFRALSCACNRQRSPGRIRRDVGDFVVKEELPFAPSEDGEHLLFCVRRSNLTTPEVQARLAQELRIKPKDVGYLGLKDKRSVATQWFSAPVRTPSKTITVADVEILQQLRHRKKLRPSDGCQNWFEILVRDITPELVELDRMREVPSYFGPQRFGRDGRNATNAMKWIRKGKPRISPFLRSIYISSLRSYAFNLVLAARVARGNWRKLIPGDVELNGFPTGPLWGRGSVPTSDLAEEIEEAALDSIAPIKDALEWVGLKQERRSLVMEPTHLNCEIQGNTALVHFALPSGCFATSVLRECFDIHEDVN